MTSCIMGVTCRGLRSALLLSQLLLIFFFQVITAQQTWLEKPRNQLIPLGGNATFVCKSPNLNKNIVWTKGTQVLYVNEVKFNQNIPGRYALSDAYTLTITSVQQSDNDMYGCNVQDFGSASANLTVLLPPGPPSITSDLSGDVFEEGQNVQFTCSSSGGNPPPTITWTKNGVEQINVGQTTTEGTTTRNTLRVTMDHSDHKANYTCFVYNRVNENNALIASKVLNVRYSPIITFVPFSPYTIRLGQVANITCQVDANPPVTSVRWQKNGQDIPAADFVRRFSPVRREDAANYTCFASNDLNTNNPSRNIIKVDVVYPPVVTLPPVRNIAESSRLSVTCSVDANPYPYQITWEKVLPDGRRQQKSNSERLEIALIKREDAGNYSCKASSLLKVSGENNPETAFGEAFMYINVEYKPGAASITPVGNIDVGQRLQITCSATPAGFPSARFRWKRNGAEQPRTEASYVVNNAQLSDSANYSCQPFNSVGNGTTAFVSVCINEPPRLVQQVQDEITRTISNTQPLTLTCKGQGRPEPIIEWFKDNMTDSVLTMPQFYSIQSSSRLRNTYSYEVTSTLSFKGAGRETAPSGQRTMLRIEDLGNYTCRVRSPVHTAAPSSTVQLKVQFAPVVLKVSQKVAVLVSNQADLPCEAQSYPRPVFQWYRDGQLIDINAGKYSERQTALSGVASGYTSQLTISNVGSRDYGLYHCFVSNFLANVTATVNVTTKFTPEAPTSLQTLGRTWESVHLKWSPGFDGGYRQQYQVQVQELGPIPGEKYVLPAQPLSVTEYNITGLKPSTTYEFTVFGRNKLGNGQHSIAITKQTWELEIPSLGEAVPVFHTESKQLVLMSQPTAQYCLKIDAKDTAGKWRTIKQCTRVLGGGSLEIMEEGIIDVNVSVCLVDRPEVCGPPTKAQISRPDKNPTLTERDVIIIACVCAVIIITLLIVLICFICRRRRANGKEYDNSGVPPPASNGGVPVKKMQQGPGQSYDNADGRYPTFASSSEHPPTYWDSNSPDHDLDGHYDHRNNLSFDSQIDRQLYEHELNRRNDLAIYGRADGFRGQQESIHMQSRPMSPSKDKYIDLEDRKDPSLQSQESGYSTGDINKPKKVIYEVVV